MIVKMKSQIINQIKPFIGTTYIFKICYFDAIIKLITLNPNDLHQEQ